jgi:hypothetical protein
LYLIKYKKKKKEREKSVQVSDKQIDRVSLLMSVY